jgi:hypothetical protein
MKASQLASFLITVKDSSGKVLKTVPAPSKYAAKQVANRLFAACDVGHTVEVDRRDAA